MRILFSFVGGHGHFEPLVPIARAAEEAGHSVAFGCAPAMVSAVGAADFTVFAMGKSPGGPPERLPLLPIGADQPLNAERCTELGVAAILDPLEVTPEGVRAEVSKVLHDPSYRRNAELLRDEISALPELGEAVGLIEQLALDGGSVPK